MLKALISNTTNAIKNMIFGTTPEFEEAAYKTHGAQNNEIFFPLGTQAAAHHANLDFAIDGVTREYETALKLSEGKAKIAQERIFKDDKGELFMETIHDMECHALGQSVPLPITITAAISQATAINLRNLERERKSRTILAFQTYAGEQEKLDQYIEAKGALPPEGVVAVNLAIGIAKKTGIDISNHQAIIAAIKPQKTKMH